MKKLMMFAAAMTIVGGAYASVCAPGSEASPCDTPVWDFVMKGKTANGIEKGYKAVYAISYKGAIVGNLSEIKEGGSTSTSVEYVDELKATVTNEVPEFTDPVAVGVGTNWLPTATNALAPVLTYTPTNLPTPKVGAGIAPYTSKVVTEEQITYTNALGQSTFATRTLTSITETYWRTAVEKTVTVPGVGTGKCCLDSFTVYVYDKDDKALIVFEDQQVLKMSVFGKGWVKELKPGGSATLESDVMWNMGDDEDIALQFVGFGKAKYSLSKGGTSGSVCNPHTEVPCIPDYDWPSWSGWFTGFFGPETDKSYDLNCAASEECVAVAGGTWSAKLNKKLSAASDVEGAIYRKFKVSYLFDDEE